MEISHLPNQFPEGLRVFVIDHDTSHLNAIANMCIQCNYVVLTCPMASFALNLLRQTKGRCSDVILIEAQMLDMDSYEFLQRVTQEFRIPVIMMSVDESTSARMKAIVLGACDFWLKPLNVNHINNMWQHAARIQHDQIQRTLELEVKTGQKIMKSDESATKETNVCVLTDHNDKSNESATKETNVCVLTDNNNYHTPTKKNRVSWRSQNLHEQFLRVVNELGVDKATPKKITKLMDVPGLTTGHVASHLQKYRLRLKNSSKKTKTKSGRKNSVQSMAQHFPNESVVQLMAEHVPNESFPNESVVQSMVEHVTNESVVDSMKELVFDDFDISNLLTNSQSMMLDDDLSSFLFEEAAWYPHSSMVSTY